jgi:3-deoxy-manno-octulosonate cytidylyltransferase (CMP-KDO synthetase)
MPQILGVIPARYASTRLEGKPLVDIGGKSMIQRVYEQARKCQLLTDVVVATDDERIFNHIQSFGGKALMTHAEHPSGTDRCAEVAEKLGAEFEVIINIQGDEPFLNPAQIDQIAALFSDDSVQIATLAKKIVSYEELIDEKEAKITLDEQNNAVYFSRSPIPFLKGQDIQQWHTLYDFYKHIGVYAFRAEVLRQIPELPVAPLEKAEGLEQLRWLSHYKIKVGFTEFETFAIDTAEDLKQVGKFL